MGVPYMGAGWLAMILNSFNQNGVQGKELPGYIYLHLSRWIGWLKVWWNRLPLLRIKISTWSKIVEMLFFVRPWKRATLKHMVMLEQQPKNKKLMWISSN